MKRSGGIPLVAFLAFGAFASARGGEDPLHVRIDKVVESAHVGAPAPPADDAAFLRRITLDLTGTIPSADEARAFLDDTSSDKRAKAIDRLLASRGYVRHMARTFDVMLMERRRDKYVKTDPWRKYLVDSFAANKPYDQLAREILGADGVDPKMHPAAKFYLEREVEPNALTRDVGRMFFGMDLQCAQCHDHPRIGDYYQRDYYGLYAFLNRSYLFRPDKKKPAVLAEKAEGDVKFKSVFTKAEGSTRPRLPGGVEISEPTFKKGEEYKVKPDKKKKTLRPIPRYSRLAQLARHATDGKNRAFNRNIVNRLWAHMMGRGLVEPVDLHHSKNPPLNPELLELLADAIVAMKYDVRGFLRELALTRAYQRSFEIPAELAAEAKAAAGRLATLKSATERLEAAAEKSRDAVGKISADLAAARKAVASGADARTKAAAAVAAAKKAAAAGAKERDTSKKALADRRDLLKTVQEAAAKAQEAVAKLPDDKELAAAAGTFKARAGRLVGEVRAASKELAGKEAAVKGLTGKVASAEKAAADLEARRAKAEADVKAREGRLAAAVARKKAEGTAAIHAARRVAAAEALVAYGKLYAAAEASRKEAERVRADLFAAKKAVASLPAALPKGEAERKAARKAHEEAARGLTQAREGLGKSEEVAKVLAEAAVKAEAVKRKAPKDKELVAAAAKIKARSDRANAELAAKKKAFAGLEEAARKAASRHDAARQALEKAKTELASARKRIPSLEKQLEPAAEKAAADRDRLDEAQRELTSHWSDSFAVGPFAPLTPEQLCWSMLQATGQVRLKRAAGEAEFDKKNKSKNGAERAKVAEQYAHDKLKANVSTFVSLYGAAAGQPQDDFFATADQALFMANGGNVRGWLAPSRGSLTDRLNRLEDPKALAEELYLAVLTRRPTGAEAGEVERYLAARSKEKSTAVQELAWALLSSVEFRFRH